MRMSVIVSTIVGLVIWLVLWSMGIKAIDALFIPLVLLLGATTMRLLASEPPGNPEG